MVSEGQFKKICRAIERALQNGKKDFIIYPFGRNGMEVKNILNTRYGIRERCILDNTLCKFRQDVFSIDDMPKKLKECMVLLTIENPRFYNEIFISAKAMFPENQIVKIFDDGSSGFSSLITKIGKYTSGSLAHNHPFIKEIGAFSSFAVGDDVVSNHPTTYISTHGFIYDGNRPIDKMCTPPGHIPR